MATSAGYKWKIEVSGDGGSTFNELTQVTSGSFNITPNTEDKQYWQEAFTRAQKTGTTIEFTAEGDMDRDSEAHKILNRALLENTGSAKGYRLFKLYINTDDAATQHIVFSALVSNYSPTGDATTTSTFSLTLAVDGSTVNTIGDMI